jgi:hypothetical protein
LQVQAEAWTPYKYIPSLKPILTYAQARHSQLPLQIRQHTLAVYNQRIPCHSKQSQAHITDLKRFPTSATNDLSFSTMEINIQPCPRRPFCGRAVSWSCYDLRPSLAYSYSCYYQECSYHHFPAWILARYYQLSAKSAYLTTNSIPTAFNDLFRQIAPVSLLRHCVTVIKS